MKNEYENQETVMLQYVQRETLKLFRSEILTHPNTQLFNNFYAPHFPPFYHVEIEKEKGEQYRDFVVHITTLILPFSLREGSIHFLFEINEDFDDDLLMEAVDLIDWINMIYHYKCSYHWTCASFIAIKDTIIGKSQHNGTLTIFNIQSL